MNSHGFCDCQELTEPRLREKTFSKDTTLITEIINIYSNLLHLKESSLKQHTPWTQAQWAGNLPVVQCSGGWGKSIIWACSLTWPTKHSWDNFKTKKGSAQWYTVLTPTTRRQKRVYLCESISSLVYIPSVRTAGATQWNPVSKQLQLSKIKTKTSIKKINIPKFKDLKKKKKLSTANQLRKRKGGCSLGL